jgi:hypothetical protein
MLVLVVEQLHLTQWSIFLVKHFEEKGWMQEVPTYLSKAL